MFILHIQLVIHHIKFIKDVYLPIQSIYQHKLMIQLMYHPIENIYRYTIIYIYIYTLTTPSQTYSTTDITLQ